MFPPTIKGDYIFFFMISSVPYILFNIELFCIDTEALYYLSSETWILYNYFENLGETHFFQAQSLVWLTYWAPTEAKHMFAVYSTGLQCYLR